MRVLVAAAALAATLTSLPALACGNSMREFFPTDPHERTLRVARRELQRGNAKGAYELATGLLEQKAKEGTLKWARRVAGLAALQLGHTKQAVFYLERSMKEFSEEPYVVAKLAEAELAAGARTAGQARLEALDKQDLVPDADGYVALGRARQQGGDVKGALAAVKKALARSPKHAGALALRDELEHPQKKVVTQDPA